mgnify:CR=1 FL=1
MINVARDPNDRYASTEELRREIARLRRYLPLVTCGDLGRWVSQLLQQDQRERALREARGETEPLHEAITQQLSEPRGETPADPTNPSASRGQVVLEAAFGHADLARQARLTPRHRFRVASPEVASPRPSPRPASSPPVARITAPAAAPRAGGSPLPRCGAVVA